MPLLKGRLVVRRDGRQRNLCRKRALGTGRPRKGIARRYSEICGAETTARGLTPRFPRPVTEELKDKCVKEDGGGSEIRCHPAVCRSASRRPGTEPGVGGSTPAEAKRHPWEKQRLLSSARSHTDGTAAATGTPQASAQRLFLPQPRCADRSPGDSRLTLPCALPPAAHDRQSHIALGKRTSSTVPALFGGRGLHFH
jgi:hypothetical protein